MRCGRCATETASRSSRRSEEDEMPAYQLGTHSFDSRLIIGSGKYSSFEQNLACAVASGAELVTIALRRTKFDGPGPRLLDVISPERFAILPNTAGCYTAEDAITTARMGRELLGTDLVKLEVIGDDRTLFPDVAATLEAARVLVAEGFVVLPYITDDPVACQRLEALGCAAVMPLAAAIARCSDEGLRAVLESGVDWLQLRDRSQSGAALLAAADRAVAAARASDRRVRVIVNRRADVARAAGADGVHLGFDAIRAPQA